MQHLKIHLKLHSLLLIKLTIEHIKNNYKQDWRCNTTAYNDSGIPILFGSFLTSKKAVMNVISHLGNRKHPLFQSCFTIWYKSSRDDGSPSGGGGWSCHHSSPEHFITGQSLDDGRKIFSPDEPKPVKRHRRHCWLLANMHNGIKYNNYQMTSSFDVGLIEAWKLYLQIIRFSCWNLCIHKYSIERLLVGTEHHHRIISPSQYGILSYCSKFHSTGSILFIWNT